MDIAIGILTVTLLGVTVFFSIWVWKLKSELRLVRTENCVLNSTLRDLDQSIYVEKKRQEIAGMPPDEKATLFNRH